jgi:TPR repeat protein
MVRKSRRTVVAALLLVCIACPLRAAPPSDLDLGLAALDRGDHATALRLLPAAARGPDPRAAAALAGMHERGLGVPRDHAEALRWRQAAAERGDPESAYRLGLRHASGDGVERDDVAARRWFRIAAERGHGPAQQALSQLLGAAGGSDADLREAAAWHARAVAGGAVASPPAAIVKDNAVVGPTLSDIREARRLRLLGRPGQQLLAPGTTGWSAWGGLRDPVTGLPLSVQGSPLLIPGAVLLPGPAPLVVWPDGSARRGW